jgi:hypothetical protein
MLSSVNWRALTERYAEETARFKLLKEKYDMLAPKVGLVPDHLSKIFTITGILRAENSSNRKIVASISSAAATKSILRAFLDDLDSFVDLEGDYKGFVVGKVFYFSLKQDLMSLGVKNCSYERYSVYKALFGHSFGAGLYPGWFYIYIEAFDKDFLWGKSILYDEANRSACTVVSDVDKLANTFFSDEFSNLNGRKKALRELMECVGMDIEHNSTIELAERITGGSVQAEDLPDCLSLDFLMHELKQAIDGPLGITKGQIDDKRGHQILCLLFPTCSSGLKVREKITPDLCVRILRRLTRLDNSMFNAIFQEVCDYSRDVIIDEFYAIFFQCYGKGAQFLVRVFLLYLCLPTCRIYFRRYLKMGLIADLCLEDIYDELKITHNVLHHNVALPDARLKLTETEQCLFDARDAMYMHLVIGRYTFDDLDLEADFTKRVSETLTQYGLDATGNVSDVYFDEEVYRSFEKWIIEAVKAKAEYKDMPANDISLLWQRMGTSGSVEAEHVDGIKSSGIRRYQRVGRKGGVGKPHKIKPEKYTKSVWTMLHLNLTHVKTFLMMKPGMAKAILVKLESGRARILQPSTTPVWLTESLGLISAEEAVYRGTPDYSLMMTAAEELTEFINRIKETIDPEYMNIDSDYDDMNYLMTLLRLSGLWHTLHQNYSAAFGVRVTKRWDHMTLLDLMTYSTAWLSEAMYHLSTAKPGSDEFLQHLQGLWSGMFITTFGNTTSTDGYDGGTEMRLIRVHPSYTPHGRKRILGDDNRTGNRCEWSAMLYISAIDDNNTPAQRSKQNASFDLDEYLRIITTPERAFGSPVRTVCQGASGDMQAPQQDADINKAESFSHTFAVWERRGCTDEAVSLVLLEVLEYWCQLRNGPKKFHRTDKLLMFSERDCGGFGAFLPGCSCSRLVPPLVYNTYDMTSIVLDYYKLDDTGGIVKSCVEHEERRLLPYGIRFHDMQATIARTIQAVLVTALPLAARLTAMMKRDEALYKAFGRWKRSGGHVEFYDFSLYEQDVHAQTANVMNELRALLIGVGDHPHGFWVEFGAGLDDIVSTLTGTIATPAAKYSLLPNTERVYGPLAVVKKLRGYKYGIISNNLAKSLTGEVARRILQGELEIGIKTRGMIPDNQLLIVHEIVKRTAEKIGSRRFRSMPSGEIQRLFSVISTTAASDVADDASWRVWMQY